MKKFMKMLIDFIHSPVYDYILIIMFVVAMITVLTANYLMHQEDMKVIEELSRQLFYAR